MFHLGSQFVTIDTRARVHYLTTLIATGVASLWANTSTRPERGKQIPGDCGQNETLPL